MLAPMKSWVKNEPLLVCKTGLTLADLDYVWLAVKSALTTHYNLEHTQRKPPLSPFESVIITYYWLRVYPSFRSIATEVGVDVHVLEECLDHTLDALYLTVYPANFARSAPLPSVFDTGPMAGVCCVVDSTFIARHRSWSDDTNKMFYHYKCPTKEAAKVQLTVKLNGEPVHTSHVTWGSRPDIKLFIDSEMEDELALATKALGDKGYQGHDRIVTPKKKPRGGELEKKDKDDNNVIHSKRVVVENCIHVFKQWAILGRVYRGKLVSDDDFKRLTKIVRIIGAMVKRYVMTHPLRVSTDPRDQMMDQSTPRSIHSFHDLNES